MRRLLNAKNLLIAMYILVSFLGGFALGLCEGTSFGMRNNTEVRNQILDIKPYDASLEIKDLEYSDISPSGFTALFNTNKTRGNTIYGDDVYDLECEWAVYPSDIFTIVPISIRMFDKPSLRATIETYPEGGTVMFRFIRTEENTGSLWYYIDLPRPDETILPPPYMPKEDRK